MQPNQYTKNTSDLERFWSRVNKDGPVIQEELGACWVWTGNMMGRKWRIGGYGRIIVAGKRYPTHRFSWELHNAVIPTGFQVLHKCDNPPCIRPDHLFLGTNTDNVRDAIAKGLRPILRKKTHCIRGHEFTAVNTYIEKSGRRHCRTCDANRHRKVAVGTRSEEVK